MFVLIDQRRWKDILAVDYVDKRSLSFRVSTTMTRIPRHQGSRREEDGARDWKTLLHMVCRDDENAPKWTNSKWFDLLQRRSAKNKCQYCLNSDGLIHYMRAIQGDSGWNKVDASLLDNVQIPYRWSEYHYHVGSSLYMLLLSIQD